MKRKGSTQLDDADFERCWIQISEFLSSHESVRNSKVRQVTGINYDQALKFFTRAMKEGKLERKGRKSSTHYTLTAQGSCKPQTSGQSDRHIVTG